MKDLVTFLSALLLAPLAFAVGAAAASTADQKPQQEFTLKEHFGVSHAEQVVMYEREFVFVKNRFLASRETITFEESFKARIAPLWNTRNIGPQVGAHWANTFMGTLVANNGTVEMECPPVDLLVWFAPRPDCRLQVVDRLVEDARAIACSAQVRY